MRRSALYFAASDYFKLGVFVASPTPRFCNPFAVYSTAFPNWAAMLKTEPARQKGRKWATLALREWKMKCFPGFIGLSTPILLLSLFTGLSRTPIFSQNASIAQQRLFWLGTAFCMRNLSFFVRAGLNAFQKLSNHPPPSDTQFLLPLFTHHPKNPVHQVRYT